jgi:stage V sporulation protein K
MPFNFLALNLTGQHVGHTKNIFNAALERAKGGVLFIDEAYSLLHCDFGKEVIDVLVSKMH